MMSEGIINLNKPRDMTSHDCVQAIRKITGIKRIGHTGTLDPQADGVLPICIGGAVRIMEYLDLDFKTYRAEMELGLVTETQDIWGSVVSDGRDKINDLSAESIGSAFESFNGLIEQTPPKYSALKYAGKRLYEYARAGVEIEIKKRNVFIKDISVNDVDLTGHKVSFNVTCSKGTYVRAICNDVGAMLGCGGAMSGLTRVASGAFSLEDAVTLSGLSDMGKDGIKDVIKPVDFPLVHFGRAILNDEGTAERFTNGRPVAFADAVVEDAPEYSLKEPYFAIREEYKRAYNMYTVQSGQSVFLGVAFLDGENREFAADKVFFKGEISEAVQFAGRN